MHGKVSKSNKSLKNHYLLSFFIAILLIVVSFHGVHAGTSISGDDVCGKLSNSSNPAANECRLDNFKAVSAGILKAIVSLGLPLLVVFIIYRFVMAWFALQEGNASAYKDATRKALLAIGGFVFIIALFGGIFLAMLRLLGVQEPFLKVFQLISESETISIPHAYAGTSSSCVVAPQGTSCISGYSGKQGKIVNKYAVCLADGDPCSVNNSIGTYIVASDTCVPTPLPAQPSRVANCTGKPDGTLCSGTGATLDPNGVCSSKTSPSTCVVSPLGTACISGYSRNPGKIVDQYGTCLADSDPCSTNGSLGSYDSFTQTCVLKSVPPPTYVSDCTGKPDGTLCSGTGNAVLDLNGVCKSVTTADSAPAPAKTQPQASANTQSSLPNPLGVSSLYDFILNILRLVMRFFIYPALIAIWVWTGFKFVISQGNPEGIKTAKSWLLWAVITTIVVMMVQGFLLAIQGTVKSILPGATTYIERVSSIFRA